MFVLACLAVLAFAGLVVAVSFAFAGLYPGPAIFALALPAVLWIWIVAATYRFARRRTLVISLLAIFLISAAAIGGYSIYREYDRKLQLAEEVDLNQYRPFAPESKIARLDEPSELRFTGDVPRIDGATAFYPLYAAFAEATYPAGDYPLDSSSVLCTKTIKAYENLLHRGPELIFVLEPSDEQRANALKAGKTMTLTPIGKEAFFFFVNQANPVQNLSSEQIRQIYEGKLTHWSALGGPDRKILAYQRPKNRGSQTLLEKIMRDRSLMTPPEEHVPTGMGSMISAAAYRNRSGAIGYSFLYYASRMVGNQGIRILSIDGVAPTHATIADGTYPFTTNFYAVHCGPLSPQAQNLLNWVTSPQGQQLVQKTGYVPLANPQPFVPVSETTFQPR